MAGSATHIHRRSGTCWRGNIMSDGLVTKRQYPDLIQKSPSQQLDGLDIWPDDYCQRRNRVCQVRSGGCGYRFKGGDKSWVCPKCGQDRRCSSKIVKGGKTCRMHGGTDSAGPSPKHMKYMAPQIILDNYNKVLSDPTLLTMSHEIGILTAYTQQVMDLLEDQNAALANQELRSAIGKIDKGVFNLDMTLIREGLRQAYRALDPITIQILAWAEIKDNWKLQVIMAKAQNEWLKEQDEMMPRKHVLEVIIWMNRIGLKYIRDPLDRQAYGKEVLSLLPKKKK